jgi:hypothetical protein
VTRVYLDPTALVLPVPSVPDGGEEHVAPGVGEAVGHLVEAGFQVVLLGESGPDAWPDLPPGVDHALELPEHLDQDAWYLTGDPHPAFGRPRGGTTVLVGPRRPAGKVPLPRFDLETRDLGAAAMEILTRQAMA